jgi:acetyltransferase-like isoleucine patch superfamily enzyme
MIGNPNKKFTSKIKAYIRKFISQVVAPNCVLNETRIFLYRFCGYNIGKNVFIGMRCYLDDLEPKMFTVEDNVTISYGVYFACHGRNQKHMPITLKKGSYIGMRSSVISGKKGIIIGQNAIVGGGSFVIRDVPANATVVGVPAKEIHKNSI